MFFFFQAEDGIRAKLVTGVQTCALPISPGPIRKFSRGCDGSVAAASLPRRREIPPPIPGCAPGRTPERRPRYARPASCGATAVFRFIVTPARLSRVHAVPAPRARGGARAIPRGRFPLARLLRRQLSPGRRSATGRLPGRLTPDRVGEHERRHREADGRDDGTPRRPRRPA